MLGGADNPNGELPSYITGADTGAGFILNSSRRRPFEKHLSSAIACARLVTSSSLFMVLASPSDVFISGQPLYGHFCAVCNTRRIYTFPHWLSTS